MASQANSFRNAPEQDTFKILVATDIHLGYKEKDAIRGQDTFNSFEEILQLAVKQEVDFLLLGGDLFHEAQPSPYCIFKCTELLRKYCLGEKPVQIEFLSDQEVNFQHAANKTVNYEDPNLNISLPVFSIHGNHDDPTGQKQISAMDLVAITGFVNYFGKCTDLQKIKINPLLIRKGESLLALYGLSHIRDERLGRLFLEKQVSWVTENAEEGKLFNLLVWHQNRQKRGPKNYIPPDAIPDFLDLVIWGHEHDCRITPEQQANDVYISQPGSSVATSLSEGEAIPKKVGLLKIFGDKFILDEIPLRSVRPFVFDEMALDDPKKLTSSKIKDLSELAQSQVTEKVGEMLDVAKTLGRLPNMAPLLRLRVRYHDEKQMFNTIRFGHSYVGKVANAEDIVLFQHVKNVTATRKKYADTNPEEMDNVSDWANDVEDIITRCFEDENTPKLKVLSLQGLNEAVSRFVQSNNYEAPQNIIEHQSKKTLEKVKELAPDIKQVDKIIEDIRDARNNHENVEEYVQVFDKPTQNANGAVNEKDILMIHDSSDSDSEIASVASTRQSSSPSKRGRGSRGGRGSTRARGKGRGKAKAQAL